MRWIGLVVLGAAALAGCGPSAPMQPQGSEGGACFQDGTCDDGLECQSGVCHAAGLPDASMQPRADARVGADAPRADAARPARRPPPPAAPPPPPDAATPPTGEPGIPGSIPLNGSPSPGAGVGAVPVEMVATPPGGGAPASTRFDCADGAGRSGELAAGSH